MLAVLVTVRVVLEAGALHVDKTPDVKLPCAANAALEQAVRVRLPKVRLGKGRPAGDDLVAIISATAGGFRFEVRKPDGAVAMSRDLFSGCAQLGDTAALILERYLAQISWAGRDVGLVPESPPPPTRPKPAPVPVPVPLPVPPLVAPEPVVVDAGVVESADLISRIGVAPEPSGVAPISAPEPSSEPPPPPKPDAGTAEPVIHLPPAPAREPYVSAVELSAGGGVWYGYPDLVGALSLELGVVLRERVRVSLLALVSTPTSKPLLAGDVQHGSIDWFDLGVFAILGVCTKTTLAVCGNAFGGGRFRWAWSTSSGALLPHAGSGAVALPEAGVLARLQLALSRFLIALDAMAGVPLGRGDIAVEGFARLQTSPIDVVGMLRVGLKIP